MFIAVLISFGLGFLGGALMMEIFHRDFLTKYVLTLRGLLIDSGMDADYFLTKLHERIGKKN